MLATFFYCQYSKCVIVFMTSFFTFYSQFNTQNLVYGMLLIIELENLRHKNGNNRFTKFAYGL